MKKLLIISVLILSILMGYSQVTDVSELRIANATTAFGRNLPVGTKVYNIADGKYWVATAGVVSTATLTTAAASFTQLNAGGADDQTASEVPITDAGEYYTGTEVETALQEVGSTNATQQTAIDLNTAKETNVPTSLSTGTVTGTTYGITSDGSADDIVLPAANATDAGLLTATLYSKLDGIESGAEANYTLITEAFEEDDGTPTPHALSQTALTANGCRVSLNGATLAPDDYTLTSTTITVDGPVLQYDKIVITYSY